MLIPILPWIIWKKQWHNIKAALPWVSGIILTGAIALPWYIAAEIKTPGFLKYYLLGEHFLRFMVKDWPGDLYGYAHNQPVGTIWAFLLLGILPWVIIFVLGVFRLRKEYRYREKGEDNLWFSYMLLWMLAPAFIFTLSRNILATYVLPGLPGFAIAMAIVYQRSAHHFNFGNRPWYLSRKTLLITAILVPFISCLVGIPIASKISYYFSQKNIVEIFEGLETYQSAKLIYYGRLPYSGQFYSRGRSRVIPYNDLKSLLLEFSDNDVDYFIITENDMGDFHPDIINSMEEIARFGKYIMLREIII